MGSKTGELYDKKKSVEFYEARYESGYMDEWPPERKRRLIGIIAGLGLPEHGDALDFGCGQGVLTDVVRQALPGWNIVGTDLSAKAVAIARERYPLCTFVETVDRKFDLLFTHHVLEHVFDLDEVLDEMDACLKPQAAMLHILPCGNAGSFEHKVCLLRHDGINEKLEGRFFFEDEGHVRRLTTQRLAALCRARGFGLEQQYYANQHDGAIEWITNSNPRFVLTFTDPANARDDGARDELLGLRRRLAFIAAARFPARLWREVIGGRRKPKHLLAALLSAPLLPFSWLVDRHWKRRAAAEWEQRRAEPAGSAMTLFFRRS